LKKGIALQILISTYIMSLLGRKVLLPALVAAFFLSCEDPGEIGITESLPNPFEVTFVDLPLNPKVAFMDSVNSTNSSSLLFGRYQDANFGVISATAYMELAITEIDFEIPENSIFDSLVLFMDVNYAYGPQPNAVMSLEARTFQGNIETSVYFTKDSIETPLVLGPSSGLLGARNRSYNSGDLNTFYFKLNDGYGEQLLNNMIYDQDSTFRNQAYFREYLSGLKVYSTNINGGVLGFNPVADSTRMSLFYHYFDDDGEKVDEEYQFRVRRGFSNVRSDFTGTPFQNLGNSYSDFDPQNEFAYHNPALGLFLKLDLTSLYNFKDTAANVIINRADLIINVDKTVTSLNPPDGIQYYQVNAGNRFVISDLDSIPRSIQIESPNILFLPTLANDPFLFGYDSINYMYGEQVTFFVNNILSEKLSDSSLVVLPLVPARDGTRPERIYYPRVNSVDQFVVRKNDVKLRLYYSKFD